MQSEAQSSLPAIEEKLNLVYTTINGWEGKLDYYQPKGATKSPLVIYIHGVDGHMVRKKRNTISLRCF